MRVAFHQFSLLSLTNQKLDKHNTKQKQPQKAHKYLMFQIGSLQNKAKHLMI